MARRELPIIRQFRPTDIATDGRAVGRNDGKVVFVEGAVPGDVVDVAVRKDKRAFTEGYVEQLVEPSPDRVTPLCEHFGTCGGCKWQNMSYAAQLRFKENFVREAISRMGKVEVSEYLPIVGCDTQYYYRNKLEYTFSARRWLLPAEMAHGITEEKGLGYHISGMFDKVLDIRNCYLQPEPGNSIRNAVKKYAIENSLSFYDIRRKEGFLRTLMIRNSLAGGWMVLVAVFEWNESQLFSLLAFLKQEFPQITSLLYVHNPKANDTLAGLDVRVFFGEDHIVEEMDGLRFKISARSFFQTNSAQALRLYDIARSFAALEKDDTVYDLYTGTGTIANYVARDCRKVIGVEYVEDAVTDARANSERNGILNTAFFAGDIKDLLGEEFFNTHGRPDVIITDPPRAGMHTDVVNAMLKSKARRIVYVSCNPGTQARDLGLLQQSYNVVKVQPVDMFPQTTHVETVALLERRA